MLLKNILLLVFAILCLSCKKRVVKPLLLNNGVTNTSKKILIKKTSKEEIKPILLDTLKVGSKFYRLSDFKDYRYIEIDTYENFLVDNNDNMYHIIIYEKDDFRYAVIGVLENNIGEGELSPLWKKTIKTVTDVIKYPKSYEACWNYSFTDSDIKCCLFMVFDTEKVDYDLKKGLNDNNREEILSKKAFKVWKINDTTNKFEKQDLEEYINLLCY